MKRRCVTFCLMVASLLCFYHIIKMQFKLLNPLVTSQGNVDLSPYLSPFIINYNSAIGSHQCTPDYPNIATAANSSLNNPSAILSFDVELSYGCSNYPPTAFTESLNNYIAIVKYFNGIYSLTKIGFYAMPSYVFCFKFATRDSIENIGETKSVADKITSGYIKVSV